MENVEAKRRAKVPEKRVYNLHHPYDDWTRCELGEMAKSRGISVLATTNKVALVALLEKADARFTFPFMALPLGIRERIYYFAVTQAHPMRRGIDPHHRPFSVSNELKRNDLVEPPLTCVSRQIRRECLPVHYRTRVLTLYPTRKPFTMRRFHPTSIWLKNNKDEHLMHIRSFTLPFWNSDYESYELRIELCGMGSSFSIRF